MAQISWSVDASVTFTFVPFFRYAVLDTDTNSCHQQATLATPTKMCVHNRKNANPFWIMWCFLIFPTSRLSLLKLTQNTHRGARTHGPKVK